MIPSGKRSEQVPACGVRDGLPLRALEQDFDAGQRAASGILTHSAGQHLTGKRSAGEQEHPRHEIRSMCRAEPVFGDPERTRSGCAVRRRWGGLKAAPIDGGSADRPLPN